jgi:hypothetical protein
MTAETSPDPESETDDSETEPPLPPEVVDEAERLTRLAREAIDDAEAVACRDERRALLDEHGYTTRLRTEDHGEILVLHPAEWERDGKVDATLVDDVSRAVEVPLDGVGDPGDWDDVEAHNRAVARRVREAHGAVHGANAEAFADFMGNHYARPVEEATDAMVREFVSEYFVRNAWPTEDQRAAVDESVELVVETARDQD